MDYMSTYYNIINMILEITVVHKKWILHQTEKVDTLLVAYEAFHT